MNPTIFTSGAHVVVERPVFDNGYSIYSEQNKAVALHYVHCLVEEQLNAAQGMQASFEDVRQYNFQFFMISDYFRKYDITAAPFNMLSDTDMRGLLSFQRLASAYREVDVYAKMLEIFGVKYLPEYYQTQFHPYKIELAPRDRVMADLPPPGYEK